MKIKLKKDEYFDVKKYINNDFDIYIIKGARGCGKSYSVVKYLIDEMITTKRPFVFARNTFAFSPANMIVGTLKRIVNPVELAYALGLNFDEKYGVDYVNGKPFAKMISLKYKPVDEIHYQYFHICSLVSVREGQLSKGLDFEVGKEPFAILYDEFTSELSDTFSHYERSFADIRESLFRDRKHRIFMLTNANTKINLFQDFFDKYYFIDIIKQRDDMYLSKQINDYMQGKNYKLSIDKHMQEVGFYRLNKNTFTQLFYDFKTDRYVLFEALEKDSKNFKQDNNIFSLKNLEFSNDYLEKVWKMTKTNLFFASRLT